MTESMETDGKVLPIEDKADWEQRHYTADRNVVQLPVNMPFFFPLCLSP